MWEWIIQCLNEVRFREGCRKKGRQVWYPNLACVPSHLSEPHSTAAALSAHHSQPGRLPAQPPICTPARPPTFLRRRNAACFRSSSSRMRSSAARMPSPASVACSRAGAAKAASCWSLASYLVQVFPRKKGYGALDGCLNAAFLPLAQAQDT